MTSATYHTPYDDEFELDDGTVPGRGRKRTKFARHSGAWRLIDRSDDEIDPADVDHNRNEVLTGRAHSRIPADHPTAILERPLLNANHHLDTTDQECGTPVAAVDPLQDDAAHEPVPASTTPSDQYIYLPNTLGHSAKLQLESQLSIIGHELYTPASQVVVSCSVADYNSNTYSGHIVMHEADTSTESLPLDVNNANNSSLASDVGLSARARNSRSSFDKDTTDEDDRVAELIEEVDNSDPDIRALSNGRELATDASASDDSSDPASVLIDQAADLHQVQTRGVNVLEESYVDFDQLQQEIDAEREFIASPPGRDAEDEDMYGSSVVMGEAEGPTQTTITTTPAAMDQHSRYLQPEIRTPFESAAATLPDIPGSRPQYINDEAQPIIMDRVTQDEHVGFLSPIRLEAHTHDGTSAVVLREVNHLLSHPDDLEIDLLHDSEVVSGMDQEAGSSSSISDRDNNPEEVALVEVKELVRTGTADAQQQEQSVLMSAKLDALLYTPDPTQEVQENTQYSDSGPMPYMHDLPMTPEATQQTTYQFDGVARETTATEAPDDQMQPAVARPRQSDNLFAEYFTPRKVFDPNDTSDLANLLDIPAIEESESTPEALAIDEGRIDNSLRREDSVQAAFDAFAHGNATDVSYYAPLGSLVEYFGQYVDVLAIVTTSTAEPERARSGPHDFYVTLHLTDSSFDTLSSTTITAQIFRPHRNALPLPKRGEVIILRNMRVHTRKHQPLLSSTDSSAWAVFSVAVAKPGDGLDGHSVVVSGPPIEYGDIERERIRYLRQWWLAKEQQSGGDDDLWIYRQDMRTEEVTARMLDEPEAVEAAEVSGDEKDGALRSNKHAEAQSKVECRPVTHEHSSCTAPRQNELVHMSTVSLSRGSLTTDQPVGSTLGSDVKEQSFFQPSDSGHELHSQFGKTSAVAPIQPDFYVATQDILPIAGEADTTETHSYDEHAAGEKNNEAPPISSDSNMSEAEEVIAATSDPEGGQITSAASLDHSMEGMEQEGTPFGETSTGEASELSSVGIPYSPGPTNMAAAEYTGGSESVIQESQGIGFVEAESSRPQDDLLSVAENASEHSGSHAGDQLSSPETSMVAVPSQLTDVETRLNSYTEPGVTSSGSVIVFDDVSPHHEIQSPVSFETPMSKRYRRRDTSNVHELRDGTTYIDHEDHEIVSVDSGEELRGDEAVVEVDSDADLDEVEAALEHQKEIMSLLQAEATLHELENTVTSEVHGISALGGTAAVVSDNNKAGIPNSAVELPVSLHSASTTSESDAEQIAQDISADYLMTKSDVLHDYALDTSNLPHNSASNVNDTSVSESDSDDSAAVQLRLEASHHFSTSPTENPNHRRFSPPWTRSRGRPATKKSPAQAQAQTKGTKNVTSYPSEEEQDDVIPQSSPGSKSGRRNVKVKDINTDRVTRSRAGK